MPEDQVTQPQTWGGDPITNTPTDAPSTPQTPAAAVHSDAHPADKPADPPASTPETTPPADQPPPTPDPDKEGTPSSYARLKSKAQAQDIQLAAKDKRIAELEAMATGKPPVEPKGKLSDYLVDPKVKGALEKIAASGGDDAAEAIQEILTGLVAKVDDSLQSVESREQIRQTSIAVDSYLHEAFPAEMKDAEFNTTLTFINDDAEKRIASGESQAIVGAEIYAYAAIGRLHEKRMSAARAQAAKDVAKAFEDGRKTGIEEAKGGIGAGPVTVGGVKPGIDSAGQPEKRTWGGSPV